MSQPRVPRAAGRAAELPRDRADHAHAGHLSAPLPRRVLPRGTVTFLFTDVEGSTRLLHELGAGGYADALADHRRALRTAFDAHGGVEVDTQGDAFFVAFPTAPGALAAAAEALDRLEQGPIRVRMGVHTGTPHVGEEGYVGVDVHRAARIAAAGHGGQVLVSAATAALAGTNELRDLGEHRLKDLSAPERIFQLGVREFPPLASLHQTNLPVPATPFLGRDRELAEARGLLARDDVRLLTLTGPGGTGKTRLALQAAGALADLYPQGVWWVPLAPLRDPELVLEEAAQALGAKDGLAAHIGDRRLLLLFDNFEHVMEAAEGVAELLASCRELDVLVTSREPLHLTAEQEFPVPPLAPEEAVGFFLARARGVDPTFEADDAVAEICRRLDELPLALELAAARVKALSPAQILERLERRLPLLTGGARDLPERQRTLRATVEWSYELLTLDEQRLFARLAVFRGGCTLGAAEAVAGAELDTLQSLVDKSLLRRSGERYWMLETILEYAGERLDEAGEREELRRAHALHFLALAEEAEPHLRGDPGGWRDVLEREHDNVRAALDHLDEDAERELALRLAAAVAPFWFVRSHFVEGRRRLEHLLADGDPSTAARAKALNGLADMLLGSGAVMGARRRSEEALALHRQLGDTRGIAESLWGLGGAIGESGDWVTAREHISESHRLYSELGDDHSMLWVTRSLAWTYHELGELERARALHEDNLERAQALGNRSVEATTLGALSGIAIDQGRVEEALSMLRENMLIFRELGDLLPIAQNLARAAAALAAAERPAAAARVVAAAQALCEELGAGIPWVTRLNEETVARARATLEEPHFTAACAEGRALSVDEAVELALDALL